MRTMRTMKKIELTKAQNECVNFSGGDLLIKGVAGSGKSIVILRRAVKKYKENQGNASVKIFTYTNTLVKYTDELIGTALPSGSIEVSTVDSYFSKIYKTLSGRSFYSDDKKCRELVSKTLSEHQKNSRTNHRFYSIDCNFWYEEFQWIEEKNIRSESEYLSASRKGRGANVKMQSDDEKRKAWSIFDLYRKKMKTTRCYIWPELYLYINDNIGRIPDSYRIDYVFVDEAQDLTVGKLKALKGITKKSITIAADMAQKIYKTSFTWKEVGIDIQGRSSKSLSASFRSTKQIVTLAEDLMANNRKSDALKDELTDSVLPDSEGPLPMIVSFKGKLAEETYLVSLARKLLASSGEKTIGIICKTKKYYYHIRALFDGKMPYQEIFRDGKYIPEWKLLEPGLKLVMAHSAKGLEFDYVIIPDVDEGNYPMLPFKMDVGQIDELLIPERSLLYVAMTRAREFLVMLHTDFAKSRFIEELDVNHYKGVKT